MKQGVNDLQVPRPRLEITRNIFSCKGPKVCGMISQTMLEMSNLVHFLKSRLETIFGLMRHRRPSET